MINNKKKILYVDDNPMDKALVKDALEREHTDFVLTEVASKTEMESALDNQEFDLVLTDFNILGFEGLQVIDYVKSNYPHIPVIVVTGTGSETIAVEAMKRSARDYIIKSPQHIRKLPASISKAIKAKKNEEQLNLLTRAVQQSNASVIITNKDGIIKYVNPAFENVSGYSSHEALGNNPRILKSGKMDDEFYKEMWETISSGNTWKGVFINKKKNDEYYWGDTVIDPIVTPLGKIKHFVAIQRDTTEQRKTEELLKKTEFNFRTFANYTTDWEYWEDAQNKMMYMSPSCERITGYTQDEFISNPELLTSIVHQEDIDSLIKHHADSYNYQDRNNIYDIEFRVIKKDKTVINIHHTCRPIFDTDKEFLGRRVSNRDITKRKRTEQIQRVLYNISNAVISTANLEELIGLIRNELGTIIDTTNFYIALYNEQTDTFSLPFVADEFDNKESFPAGKTITRYVLQTQKPLLADLNVLTKLEKSGYIELHGSASASCLGVPLKIEDKIIGVLVVQSYTDKNACNKSDLKILEFVSDQISVSIYRKEAEDNLRAALIKAEENERLKTAFLANISHEIRTPMNGILGFIGFLEEPDIEEENKAQYIEIVKKSGLRLLNTINDIIEISKLEEGQVSVQKSRFNLSVLLEDLTTFFQPEANNKGLQLLCHIPNKNVEIESDKSKLESVFTNLIKNAIKFTSSGKIEINMEINHSHLLVCVKDTGMGIPKEKQEMVFNRFVQADTSSTRPFEGSGLGLSISKEYLQMLNAEIRLESEQGKGSAFYVEFPLDGLKITS